MKIAMIVPYPIFPPDEGGRVRAYNLLKHLSADHEVLLLTPRSPSNSTSGLPIAIHEVTPPGRRHQILSVGFLRHASKIIRDERPDLLLLEFPWGGIHAALLSRRFGIPFVLDAHNVEADRFRDAGSRWWRLISPYERIVARLASRVWVVSAQDRDRFVAKGVARSRIDVIPNGFDPSVLKRDEAAGTAVRGELGIGDETRMFLFFGQLDYTPNRQALATIEREIAPRLDRSGIDYQIVVAGKGARGPSTQAHTRYVGAVNTISRYINAADAVLVPITTGGGTRLKIIESIACGTPVVSTSIGAEGIDRSACGDRLTVADDWDGFAADLAAMPVGGNRNVPAAFSDMYSWANIVRRAHWPKPRSR